MRLVFTILPQSVTDTDNKTDRETVKDLVSMTLSFLTCKMGLVPYSPTTYYYRGMILDLHSTPLVLGTKVGQIHTVGIVIIVIWLLEHLPKTSHGLGTLWPRTMQ